MASAVRVLVVVAAAAVAAACSSDAGSMPTMQDDAESACLERPGELQRPPTGKLPCDLIPPGLSLK